MAKKPRPRVKQKEDLTWQDIKDARKYTRPDEYYDDGDKLNISMQQLSAAQGPQSPAQDPEYLAGYDSRKRLREGAKVVAVRAMDPPPLAAFADKNVMSREEAESKRSPFCYIEFVLSDNGPPIRVPRYEAASRAMMILEMALNEAPDQTQEIVDERIHLVYLTLNAYAASCTKQGIKVPPAFGRVVQKLKRAKHAYKDRTFDDKTRISMYG